MNTRNFCVFVFCQKFLFTKKWGQKLSNGFQNWPFVLSPKTCSSGFSHFFMNKNILEINRLPSQLGPGLKSTLMSYATNLFVRFWYFG